MRLPRNPSAILALSILSATAMAATDSTSVVPSATDAASTIASKNEAVAAGPTTTDASSAIATTQPTDTNDDVVSSNKPLATITPTGSVETTDSGSVPTLTSSTSALPSLTATASGADAVNTYPAPSVPNLSNAPFMQTSSLPSNFVFIIVGAVLALLTLGILAWRGFLAWELNRSVKRAALLHDVDVDKRHFTRPVVGMNGGIYGGGGGGKTLGLSKSNISLNMMRRSSHQILGTENSPNPSMDRDDQSFLSSAQRQSSLFFSPTATNPNGTGRDLTTAPFIAGHNHTNSGGGGGNHSRRGSAAYFPSGYYATADNTAAGQSMQLRDMHGSTTQYRDRDSRELLWRNSRDQQYSRASLGRDGGSSPPDSPILPPTRRNADHRELARAPSLYLDDLMDGEIGAAVGRRG